MRLTKRDGLLLEDLAHSHVLSRDQILELGYFSSITRVNTRLRDLQKHRFVNVLDTPFFGQRLYQCGKQARDVVSVRTARLIVPRQVSPRFLQHALATTNVRIALRRRGEAQWRFEQELWRKVSGVEIRPDGLFLGQSAIFVEVDMGHVAPAKFREKLLAYGVLSGSGQCKTLFGFSDFRVLTVTTGSLRARHLRRLHSNDAGFPFLVQTFEEVGAAPISSWS